MTRILCLVPLLVGCLRAPDGYRCAIDTECLQGGVTGRCETDGYCSFPDPSCAGGSRFGELSGSVSNQCTGTDAGTGDVDANDNGPPRFLSSAHAHDGIVSTLTFPLTIPDDSKLYLIVAVELTNAGVIATITYDGMPLTVLTTVVGVPASSTARSEQWQLVAPSVGTHDVVVSLSTPGMTINAGALAFANVNQAQPVFAKASGSGAATTSDVTVASMTNDLVESTTAQGNSISTLGAGENLVFVDNVSNMSTSLANSAASTAPGSATSTTMEWTYGGSDQWQAIVVSLQP